MARTEEGLCRGEVDFVDLQLMLRPKTRRRRRKMAAGTLCGFSEPYRKGTFLGRRRAVARCIFPQVRAHCTTAAIWWEQEFRRELDLAKAIVAMQLRQRWR